MKPQTGHPPGDLSSSPFWMPHSEGSLSCRRNFSTPGPQRWVTLKERR